MLIDLGHHEVRVKTIEAVLEAMEHVKAKHHKRECAEETAKQQECVRTQQTLQQQPRKLE